MLPVVKGLTTSSLRTAWYIVLNSLMLYVIKDYSCSIITGVISDLLRMLKRILQNCKCKQDFANCQSIMLNLPYGNSMLKIHYKCMSDDIVIITFRNNNTVIITFRNNTTVITFRNNTTVTTFRNNTTVIITCRNNTTVIIPCRNNTIIIITCRTVSDD